MNSGTKTSLLCLLTLSSTIRTNASPDRDMTMLPVTKLRASQSMALYVANSPNGTISQYHINSTGALEPLSPPNVPAGGGNITQLIISPNRHFAYGLDGIRNTAVFQYRISSDGHLIPLSPPSLPVGKGDEGNVYLTPDGRFAYCPNMDDNTLSQFAVQKDGRLRPLSPPIVSTGKGPVALIAAPNSKNLYCANYEDRTISLYTIQANGQLSALSLPHQTHAQPTSSSLGRGNPGL